MDSKPRWAGQKGRHSWLWSKQEEKFLRTHAGELSAKQIATKLGRTVWSVRSHACDSHIRLTDIRLKQYDEFLRNHVGKLTVAQIAEQLGISWSAVKRRAIRLGLRVGTRVYTIHPGRENGLWTHYRMRYWDIVWLYAFQSGKCLWCGAQLPEDPLFCLVDHIGGKMGFKNRGNVRGLCCSDGICNTLAGRIEKNHIQKQDWGALSDVVARIKHVLRTNYGHLPFPRNEDATWRTEPQLLLNAA